MPIRLCCDDSWFFDPETIRALSTAFEQTCADLPVLAGDQRGRETIAARIIDPDGEMFNIGCRPR